MSQRIRRRVCCRYTWRAGPAGPPLACLWNPCALRMPAAPPPLPPSAAERHRGDAMQLFLQELCSHEPLAPTQHAKYATPGAAAGAPAAPAATLSLRLRPAAAARQQQGGLLSQLGAGGKDKGPDGMPAAWVECALQVEQALCSSRALSRGAGQLGRPPRAMQPYRRCCVRWMSLGCMLPAGARQAAAPVYVPCCAFSRARGAATMAATSRRALRN